MTLTTRFYQLLDDPRPYFRVASGGVFSTWNPIAKSWDHVTKPAVRDYLSRAVENGDAVPLKPDEAARLR